MSENKKQRVLIIGGGLTGLSLGVQLLTHAAAYYEPVIFEKVITNPLPSSLFFFPLPPTLIQRLTRRKKSPHPWRTPQNPVSL